MWRRYGGSSPPETDTMGKEKISFLTSDLAVALGLPRTTVNDWLMLS